NYAGAHNPLYLLRNGDLIETKGDRVFIGSHPDIEFTNHEIPLESGDFLYLFTDGFADQRGGPSDKKFYYQPFQDMLQQIHQTETDEQRTHLDNVVTDWIGGNEQIDDIIVFGLKVA
ncbi:MAG: SpoIIE family protein phosphatase, partial [Flavobacteriales bacterium]|nr:SpoIIE family protein phosphatase [Flavobacteriales bacterium]